MTSRLVLMCAGAAALLSAQSMQTMRANIRGGGSSDAGKCTIEVEVDGAADVEIRGDTAYLRTLQGQPATWRRFDCTVAMPRNPADFRFRGVDGRGNVQLLRSPDRGGAAVVRIEDSKGGREGYTFDVEWRGGAYANDPYSRNDPYSGGGRRNQPQSEYGRNNRWSTSTVAACEDAVRVRARQDHGVRNPRFSSADVADMRGNRDRVMGTFTGNRGEDYEYSCTVKENNGRIQSVDIRRR